MVCRQYGRPRHWLCLRHAYDHSAQRVVTALTQRGKRTFFLRLFVEADDYMTVSGSKPGCSTISNGGKFHMAGIGSNRPSWVG
jgi:hypothetical protein